MRATAEHLAFITKARQFLAWQVDIYIYHINASTRSKIFIGNFLWSLFIAAMDDIAWYISGLGPCRRAIAHISRLAAQKAVSPRSIVGLARTLPGQFTLCSPGPVSLIFLDAQMVSSKLILARVEAFTFVLPLSSASIVILVDICRWSLAFQRLRGADAIISASQAFILEVV